MALLIGRQGYLGYAVEATAGSAESTPSTFLPFTENTLVDKHEKLMDITSRATRVKDHDARDGKKWGEGDVAGFVDATQFGYILKVALGNEVKTVVGGTPEVNDHHFYVTASGNTPKTATLWNFRGSGANIKQHAYSCIDTLELEVTNEDIATYTAAFMTGYPSTVAAPTLATASGTLLAWDNMTAKFGTTVNAALSATATKLTSFKITVTNNVEAHYRSGSGSPDAFTIGEAEITGEYTLFFENDTELDAYRNNNKRALVVDLVGANIGGGYTERIRMNFHRMFIEEAEVVTDLDGVFALTQTFRAVQGQQPNPGYFDVIVRNLKTTVY